MDTKFKIEPFRKLMGPPPVNRPAAAFINYLGEEGIRTLVQRHYDLLVNSPVKGLFPEPGPELEFAKKNAADYFVQISGGKPCYNENRGNPMLRKRHLPFKITPEARTIWLECYRQALTDNSVPDDIAVTFWDFINIFSIWMVNSE